MQKTNSLIKSMALILCVATSAGCSVMGNRSYEPWSESDTRREVVYQLGNIYDALQTNEIRSNAIVEEGNFAGRAFMGPEPKSGDVALYFSSLAVSHYLVSLALPSRLRKYWQGGTVALQWYTVYNNCKEYSLAC